MTNLTLEFSNDNNSKSGGRETAFDPQNLLVLLCFVFKVRIGSKLILPALGRQRRADVWGSVDNLVFSARS